MYELRHYFPKMKEHFVRQCVSIMLLSIGNYNQRLTSWLIRWFSVDPALSFEMSDLGQIMSVSNHNWPLFPTLASFTSSNRWHGENLCLCLITFGIHISMSMTFMGNVLLPLWIWYNKNTPLLVKQTCRCIMLPSKPQEAAYTVCIICVLLLFIIIANISQENIMLLTC